MMKKLVALLFVVVFMLCGHYAVAEQSFEELDAEFDQLLDKMKRLNAIDEVFHNGLLICPDGGWEDTYGLEAFTFLPGIPAGEHGDEYIGMPLLLTGTVLDKKGYGIDFQLDDGRKGIVAFDTYDFAAEKMIIFSTDWPRKGKRINMYCTFYGQGFEVIDDNCLHFYATVSDTAREYALKRKR